MHTKWKNWVHVTKLDPDKTLPPGIVSEIAASGTDALMLSGTLNVTLENLERLHREVAVSGLPLVMEPASPEAVLANGIDLLFVPSVLNSSEVQWIVGKHRDWILHNNRIDWERVIPEAYIVLNPDSAVGKVTRSNCMLSPAEVASYAMVADRYFRFPIVYIEYSGMYGNPAAVKAASEVIDSAVLYYGGGINSGQRAAEMAKYADTIVVGNAVYDRCIDVLKETVKAVQ
ncbi:MAG TPA: phosphoglycerol geranylgeranyltransferase [Methanoregulaceae archaeon]|nr:MAG: phosphoglycerol geranylgeranyltransferase [Methanolinea sp.]HON81259.1 phosphoglycerol geranylgeranyltransferase [Methanoregulaceae archaeon]HPD10135.1 phosphoglycerol geranylgeranyltransferase [Methanoregulaceae archaeon]HRT15141.1 phosphoglycerol geranylgeranyltransferase [Methanoregulaceae archaeon]HRU30742.1 phosphoglycerol geranylgeranyltransferase [Methanoregulaceae archaeon]